MQHATSIYDVVRIDHFRGFELLLHPRRKQDRSGRTLGKGPDRDFIHAMHEALGEGGIIAEDLGYLTRRSRPCWQRAATRHEDHAVCL